jgi:hypothetical protein
MTNALDPVVGDPRLRAQMHDNAVKGATILTRRQCVDDLFGADAAQKIADALPAATRDVWTKPRLANAWVPMAQLVDVDGAIIGQLLGGDPSRIRELAKHSANLELNALYKFLLRLGSPDFVVKRLSVAFSTKVQKGTLTHHAGDGTRARLVLSDVVLPRYYCEHAMPCWGETAVALTGAKQVVGTKDKCRHDGHDVCAWTIAWAN